MPRLAHDSLYYADDKDIYDLLSSAKQRVTPLKLLELARTRGIILSPDENRDAVAEWIARMPFAWPQVVSLLEMTTSADRADKLTSLRMDSATADEWSEAVSTVKGARAEQRGEVWSVSRNGDSLTVSVQYSELDPGRTRLAQKRERDFVVEVETTPAGGVRVRHQSQDRAAEIVKAVCDELMKGKERLEPKRIELYGIRDPVKRTQFFLNLIAGIDGYTLEDVKSVKGSRLSPTLEVDVPSEEAGTDSDGQHEDRTERDLEAHVRRVALYGDGILHAAEYQTLFKDDFFVSSIAWTSMESRSGTQRVEFEAAFNDAEDARGFVYGVRGIWPRTQNGELRKNKVSVGQLKDTKAFHALIEESAYKALCSISTDVKQAATDEEPQGQTQAGAKA